jgi:hypothetical protein
MKRKLSESRKNDIGQWKKVARTLVQAVDDNEIFVNFGDSFTRLTRSDCIRAVSETIAESPVRNLLLKCMLDAENRSPGSSYVMLKCLADEIDLHPGTGHRFTVDDLRNNLSKFIDKTSSDIVVDSILIAGRQGKVMLDASDVQKTEIVFGSQTCRWKPSDSFFSAVGKNKISLQNCKLIFIDGIIESVSEIHRIFNDSYEQKVPVVIFARGYGEEVVATSAANIARQTAIVVPALIPFDEVGVNSMGDLASCFGAELISSDKGQLISCVKIEDQVQVDRVVCTVSHTEIESKSTLIDDVIKKLSSRLSTCDSNQTDLIRKRISAIGSGVVTIKIGSDKKSLSGIQRDRVDFGLRYVRSCMSSGIFECDSLKIPSLSVKVGIENAQSFTKMIRECGAILEVDRCG